ncbi:hypothetical protein AAMO2058_000761900 [Amorphochlora amoebiformis]
MSEDQTTNFGWGGKLPQLPERRKPTKKMKTSKKKRCVMKKKCDLDLNCFRILGHGGEHFKCPHPECHRLVDEKAFHEGYHAWCIKWNDACWKCYRYVNYDPKNGPTHFSYCKLVNSNGVCLRELGDGISRELSKAMTLQWRNYTWPRLREQGYFEKRQNFRQNSRKRPLTNGLTPRPKRHKPNPKVEAKLPGTALIPTIPTAPSKPGPVERDLRQDVSAEMRVAETPLKDPRIKNCSSLMFPVSPPTDFEVYSGIPLSPRKEIDEELKSVYHSSSNGVTQSKKGEGEKRLRAKEMRETQIQTAYTYEESS